MGRGERRGWGQAREGVGTGDTKIGDQIHREITILYHCHVVDYNMKVKGKNR